MVAIGGLAGIDTSHPGKRFLDDLVMTCRLGVEFCMSYAYSLFCSKLFDYLPTIATLYVVLSSNSTPVDRTTKRPVAQGVFQLLRIPRNIFKIW